MEVHIGTLNVCLSVCPPLRFNGAFSRAARIAESVYTSYDDPQKLDVLCLQELVVSRSTVLKGFLHHPYHTGIATSSLFGPNIRFIHSGLCIVSRWPIVEEGYHIFTGPSYHMEQFMAKAVQYAKIMVNNRFYLHVFNTHTQAWSNKRSDEIRSLQFEQMATFISQLKIPSTEPVVLCGDFNIDFYEHMNTIQTLMTTINMQLHLPETPQFSFDPTVNLLVGTDDASEYATHSAVHGCYDEYLRTGICSCCPRQLIDGICSSKHHLVPQKVEIQIVQNGAKELFEIYLNSSSTRQTRNVSDHFLVTARMEFPCSPYGPCCPIPYQIKTSVFQPRYSPCWMSLELVLFLLFYTVFVWLCFQLSRTKHRK